MTMYEIKKIISILMMMMIVVVEADNSPPSLAPPHNPTRVITCLGECGIVCSKMSREISSYATCVASCGLLCLEVASESVYDCATSCAISKINVNTGIHTFTFISFIIHYYIFFL
jgi:hypothetical protein